MSSNSKISESRRPGSRFKGWLSHALVFGFISTLSWYTPQLRNLDVLIFDSFSQSEKHAPSKEIVIVAAEDRTLRHVGGFPIDREFVRQTLAALYEANPKRVILDLMLIAKGDPLVDQGLADQMGQFDAGQLAIPALNPTSLSPAIFPNELFKAQATLVGGEFFVDTDGWHRTVTVAPRETAQFVNPARWLAGIEGGAPVRIDQRIDPSQYRRVAMLDVARGDVSDLDGKIIIIGLDANIGGAGINYPLIGKEDRMTLMALGADTMMVGSQPFRLSPIMIAGLVALIGLIALFCVSHALSAFRLGLVSAAGSITILILSIISIKYFNVSSKGAYLLSTWGAGIMISVAYKLRFAEVVREFYAGDLTPEEAWAWRTINDHASASIILSATGIKRQNKAALQLGLFGQHSDIARSRTNRNIDALRRALGENALTGPIEFEMDDRTIYLDASLPFDGLALLQLEDISDRIRETEAMTKLLETDQLTGCGNRAAMEKVLQALSQHAEPYCVILMDMNGFKAVNDTYGHQAGDDLLKHASQQFRQVLRKNDLLVRLGGDEFAVVMAGGIDEVVASGVCKALEHSLSEPVNLGQHVVRADVAAGYALSSPEQHHSVIVDAADKAMYARKALIKSGGKAAERLIEQAG